MYKVEITIWVNGKDGLTMNKSGLYDSLESALTGYKLVVSDVSSTVCVTDKGYGVVWLQDGENKKVMEFSCHGHNYLTPASFLPIRF